MSMRRSRYPVLRWWLALLAWLLLAAPGRAQDVQPVPPLSARVVDRIGWLTPPERDALERKLADFEAQAGPQIVVLLVATTAPEDIASYAQRVADTWKIGRRDVGDGVLLVAARDDRKLRIEVAKALEGAVPDLAARQIIAQSITPAFKQGQIAAGLGAGVDGLIARIRGEHLPAPQARGPAAAGAADQGLDWQALALFFFVGVPVLGGVLSAMLGRKLGSVVTAGGAGALAFWLSASVLIAGVAGVIALLLVGVMGAGAGLSRGTGRGGGLGGALGGVPPIIWGGGGGRGGGFGGGGGGGGFSSGGGGDFGGGGASGSW